MIFLSISNTSISNTFVVLMGLSIVFLGLICIILLCKLVSILCKVLQPNTTKPTAPESTPINAPQDTIVNRQEMIAAVSAAIAEDLGTDVSAIRIRSVKKL